MRRSIIVRPDIGAGVEDRTPAALLIARKRDGGELDAAEITGLIARYLAGDVEDAQMSALLMAGVIRGFSEAEAVALTEAFVASGDTVDLSDLSGPTVDKHSTGGVGDTTTLVVAPLLAAAGCQVAKLSGRGLGHTGGTLDKLEAIPGFRVDLTPTEVHAQVERIGLAVAAATADLVPADKRLYALRDVTATVPAPALIASSVMSKKIAGGASTIVLDVKTGDGAFSPTVADAVALAQLCVRIGTAHGRRTGALVTDMSQPLGDAVGNALEVAAAVEVLQGAGSARLREVSLELAAATLELLGEEPTRARGRVTDLLDRGVALERFRAFVEAQGGDARVADEPRAVLAAAPHVIAWTPPPGTVQHVACRRLGELAGQLGAGRERQGDRVDAAVGLEVLVRVGDRVGEAPAVIVHAREEAEARAVLATLPEVIRVGSGPCDPLPLLHARIGLDGPSGAEGPAGGER
jgi:pyrimidine-nucleoside phosphorylase